MSRDGSPAPTSNVDPASLPSTVMHPHKSYRRKYRKIMVKFEQQMRESSSLFKDQQKLYDISQRIAEQNDQILALLLELNFRPQIPARLRYDLRDSTTTQKDDKHEDEEVALERLRIDRHRVQKGDLSQPEYSEMEHVLLESVEFGPQQSYAALLQGDSLQRSQDDATDSLSGMVGGFLASRQEDQYLQSLDDFLDGKGTNPRAHAVSFRFGEKPADREREAQLRNPVSVYNWLRKNQPQVFLQDADHDKLKVAASRKSKRESIAKAPKAEPDPYDEEGIAVEQSMGKGKRKRDDDGGYRPKGGHARPLKRRKEESGRRSKRASMDISAT